MSALDVKLGRDLWRMKGQVLAIAAVIGFGVMLMVMMGGLVASLSETKRAYYERYRIADVFAPLTRAPSRVLDDLRAIPGVASVEGRVTGGALIDVPGAGAPISAQAVSLPDLGDPRLNAVFLAEGRPIDPNRAEEILLLQGFADAHGLGPGDRLSATMNGARRDLRIVGLAQAPEFLFIAPPGEFVPDDARFAVIWMARGALGAAYDMEGAFNEALLDLDRGASAPAVLDAVAGALAPYGDLGAYARADHLSDRFVSEEINGLAVMNRIMPPVFLAVAAFLLYIVVSRMVQTEREEIGVLKAFGYTGAEISVHYLKFIIVIAVLGAVFGSIGGVLMGRDMAGVYQQYYKFPFLVFRPDPGAFALGFAISVATAALGGGAVLRDVFRLMPAEAMHPPAPADYSRVMALGPGVKAALDQPSRMAARRLIRAPLRAGTVILGVALGMALSVAMLSIVASFERNIALNFNITDRSDAVVTFVDPLSDRTMHDLRAIPGVIEAEAFRTVPVVLRHGVRTHRGAVQGLAATPRLYRALDSGARPLTLPAAGLVLGVSLAEKLDAAPGDTIMLEVREGRRPTLAIEVAGTADSIIGSPAYMEIGALNRALREPGRASGAYLRLDAHRGAAVYATLQDMPKVAGVSLKADARAAFRRMLDEGAGSMRWIMTGMAAIISFGIVYNVARIAYAERAHDLASLRVMGFTRAETAFVLLAELGVVTLLALPLGALLGRWLTIALSSVFSTDLYRIPPLFAPEAYGVAALAVIVAALASGAMVMRDVNRLDLVAALKTRE